MAAAWLLASPFLANAAEAVQKSTSPKMEGSLAVVEMVADFVQKCQWTLLLAVLLWCGRKQLREAGEVFIEVYLRRGAKWSLGKDGFSVEPPPDLSDKKQSVVVEAPVNPENLASSSLAPAAARVAGLVVPNLLQVMTERTYSPVEINENFYLLHESKMLRPRKSGQHGIYQVRVFLESDPAFHLQEVTRVTYRLHDSFGTTEAGRVISTSDRPGNFALWLTIYGEFQIVACVERANAAPLFLTRYLDLPGRPPE